MHTTPAVPPADMADSALLVEMMTADDVAGEDASLAATQWQAAAFAAAEARWDIFAAERPASWEVRDHASGADPILMAQANPASLFASMRGEPCRGGMYWRGTDREAWR